MNRHIKLSPYHGTPSVNTAEFRSAPQFSGSTRPTTKTQANTPITQIAEVTAKGQKKFPVRPTTHPVRAGQMMPAKLANPFCGPYHLPTESEPAIRWQNA